MPNDVQDGTNSTELTVDSAAARLEGLLSDPSEKEKPANATPDSASNDDAAEEPDVEETAEQAPDEADDAEETDDEEPAAPKTRRIKVDGEEVEVTDEELEKGYSRTADYTRKTQALAEQRKAAEAEIDAVKQERAQYADYLTQLRTALEGSTPEAPDWAKLRATLPAAEYASAYVEWDQRMKEVETVKRAEHAAQQRVVADQTDAMNKYLVAERDKLEAAIPEWKDPEVGKKERVELKDFALRSGYTEDDLRTLTDHRAVLMLRNAQKWEASQKNKPEIKNRVKEVTAAIPGSNAAPKKSQRDKASARLRETGSIDDAAASIALMNLS